MNDKTCHSQQEGPVPSPEAPTREQQSSGEKNAQMRWLANGDHLDLALVIDGETIIARLGLNDCISLNLACAEVMVFHKRLLERGPAK